MRNANGYGSVVKLGGKRRKPYAVRVTVGWTDEGKQIYKYISYHANKREATIALAEFNKNPYDIDTARITFQEIYDQLVEKEFPELSYKTAKNYKSAYQNCKPLYDQVFRDEINFIWDNINKIRNADIVLILLYTGMRVSELLEIEKDNIHLEERYMIGGKKTEAGRDRTIPIHKRILPLIEKRMERSNSKYLITNKSGSLLSYDNFRKYYLRDFLEDTKVEHTIHDTRHTFVSEMSRLGIDTLIIKRIVGHSDKDVTEHYTHKNLDDLLEAIDKLD